jgi:hypothetical protein
VKTGSQLWIGVALLGILGCLAAEPRARVILSETPVTLSGEAWSHSADPPLPSDATVLGVCVSPGPGFNVSGRWTVRTPDGREARVVARAELVNGDRVKLASPSWVGDRLCVHPRRGGPLESPVRRLTLVASTPIVAERIVWHTGAP